MNVRLAILTNDLKQGKPRRRLLAGFQRNTLVQCLSVLFALSGVLQAATLIVTNTTDDGSPGTLRHVLANTADGDTIDLSGISGNITLTNGELLITNSVTIIGPG